MMDLGLYCDIDYMLNDLYEERDNMTVYLPDDKFNEIKPKAITTYPNPNIIVAVMDGRNRKIVRTSIISVMKPNPDVCKWHNIPYGSYVGTSSCGFFPKDLIAGVILGRYSMKSELSKKTGWIESRNLGTAAEAFTNLDLVTRILEVNNFKVQIQ